MATFGQFTTTGTAAAFLTVPPDSVVTLSGGVTNAVVIGNGPNLTAGNGFPLPPARTITYVNRSTAGTEVLWAVNGAAGADVIGYIIARHAS